jgi:ribokinase
VPETSSQLALIFLAENGENSIAVAPGASVLLAPSYIEQLPDSLFAQGGAFLASCEVPIETVVAGLKRARAHGMHTILNPAPARELSILAEALRFTEILTPNEGELATLLRTPAVDNGLSCDQMRKLGSMGVMAIVVTRGDRGCQILADESEPIDIPPHVVHAVDSVGAGDAFSGALAVALTERAWLRGAARFANAAAALAVTKPSAQGGMPSRREIEELLAKSGSADSTLSEAIQ